MRTLTAKEIAYALDIDESTVHRREGTTLPNPINPHAKPHCYELRQVLFIVNGKERDLICRKLNVKVNIVISENDNPADALSGYVPLGTHDLERDF